MPLVQPVSFNRFATRSTSCCEQSFQFAYARRPRLRSISTQDVPHGLLLVAAKVVALTLTLLLETGNGGARDLAQQLRPHLPPGG
jgi:hypothetical protein